MIDFFFFNGKQSCNEITDEGIIYLTDKIKALKSLRRIKLGLDGYISFLN